MRNSIATVSMGGLLPDKLKAIASAGYEGVELFEADVVAHDRAPEDIAAMSADFGLTVLALQPFRDFEGLPEPERAQAFERARRKFELARRLGAEKVLVCSTLAPTSLGGVDRCAADLAELGELAAGFGVEVGYEALAWGRHVSDYRDSWEIVRRADRPNVKLILDSFHILSRDHPVDAIRSIPADRISFVQLSDAPKLPMDVLRLSRRHRCFPGQGEFDIPGFMAALEATGYDGWLSHEIFSDRFRMSPPERIAFDGERSLIALKGVTRDGAAVPEKSAPAGVAFVEFSVGEADGAALAGLFRAMGFRHAGRHRSKAVDRFVQGDVNFVINTDREGFARSHYVTHGPSVAAIGLWVEDAARQMDRAEALLATGFRQPVGPGELEIPAIRGVGGSLVYFLDKATELGAVWDVEFEPVDDDGASGAGLVRVDHIAQTILFEELPSWRLYYGALIGLDRLPQVDVHDPAGMVESQVMLTSDRAVQIVLNSSQAGQTQSRRFMHEYFGAGVQHIAIATEDIFQTAEALRAAGVALLDIPENYFDDLEARIDLPADLAANLRAHGVLYDVDAEGAFFQLYTQVVAERFFFEIVMRTDNYAGFGAPNAQIRLAAQARIAAAAVAVETM